MVKLIYGDVFMRVVIQRVTDASVLIDNKEEKTIDDGLVVLVGFTHNDTYDDIKYITKKIINLRIFEDDNNKMMYSVKDINGMILLISQFTLYADTKDGNRPSFKDALSYDLAKKLYDNFVNMMKETNLKIETGNFGSDMKVSLTNNGPVTIIIDSKEK